MAKRTQTLHGIQISIVRHIGTGELFAIFNGDMRAAVPQSICALAAGYDAWMRAITFRCPDCRELHPASLSGYCNACERKAEMEIEAQEAE